MGTMPEGRPGGGAAKRVVVLHASDLIRAGLVAVLDREPDIHVVRTVGSVEEAIDALPAARPDVILMDLDLPGIRGRAACREVVRRAEGVAVIVWTSALEDTLIHSCLRAGARGFVRRSASAAEVVDAVRAAARGGHALPSAVVDRLVDWARRSARLPVSDKSLAANEVETIALVAQGLRNREMAARLGVSEASVKLYLRSAMRKLGVRKRSSAVAACMRRGVI